MTTIHPFPQRPGPAWPDELTHAELRRLGIETGRWALQAQPVSATPQLAYAREVHALERRFGTVMTDRLRWPHRRPRLEAAWPEPESADIHVHDDIEARMLLAGQARYIVATGAHDGWALIHCVPGDWIVLPAGLPHALLPSHDAPADMLRLFSRPRGWVAKPTGAAWPRQAEASPLAWAA